MLSNGPTPKRALQEPEAAPLLFEELAKNRRLLQEFAPLHLPSLEFYTAEALPIFKLVQNDPEPDKFRHITSSATCFASIEECPESFSPPERKSPNDPKSKNDFNRLGIEFAKQAIALELDNWVSDGKAEIYCSCRGLPYVLSKIDRWHRNIDGHLERILYQLEKEPTRFAIGEAAEYKRGKKESDADYAKHKEEERKAWYPANAYHTFWTLRLLQVAEQRFSKDLAYQGSVQVKEANRRRDELRMWARGRLGFQVALHTAQSSVLDSDQLAWALAVAIDDPGTYQSDLAEQDFIRRAFECLFSTQEAVGTWRHYAPLFHYPHAGNAYCYVFETFATLLTQALKPRAEFVRRVLKTYFPSLIRLWEYARATHTDTERGGRRGKAWSSGHRNGRALESWATASVFAYTQALRRIVGVWARQDALASLNHRSVSIPADKARVDIAELAESWRPPGGVKVSDLLFSMFVNPTAETSPDERLEPDDQPIGKDTPRSAILFGPPGTGKTTLVRAIAAAIEWDYIELHPSHFVADGLPEVQHTADRIFRTLRELDHAVVLFDEVDELVRERDIEPDQFGRFLTTSMLPRLAELWKARKVLYFVATNHIEYFDRAVTRSQRFDAILYIGPPSFIAKKEKIEGILRQQGKAAKFGDDVTQEAIETALSSDLLKKIDETRQKEDQDWLRGRPLPDDAMLAKFALLRFDELPELASHLATKLDGASTIEIGTLRDALKMVKHSKSRTVGECHRFNNDFGYERYDVSKIGAWRVEGHDLDSEGRPADPIETCGKHFIVRAPIGALAPTVTGYSAEPLPEAKLHLTKPRIHTAPSEKSKGDHKEPKKGAPRNRSLRVSRA